MSLNPRNHVARANTGSSNKGFLVQVRKLALCKKTPIKRKRMELAKSIDEQRAKSHIMYQDFCNASDKMPGDNWNVSHWHPNMKDVRQGSHYVIQKLMSHFTVLRSCWSWSCEIMYHALLTDSERLKTPKADCALKVYKDKQFYQLGLQVCWPWKYKVACHLKCLVMYYP